jgi:hypothetical protein
VDDYCYGGVYVPINMACHQSSIQEEEEDSSRQQIGRKFKEKISYMLHLEHSFVWC